MSKVNCDVSSLMLNIRQAGERVQRGVFAVMKDEAEQMRDLAKSYAPVDQHNLEKSIKMEIEGGDRDLLGRFTRRRIRVYVDEGVGAPNNKTVGDYALVMHEMLAPYGSGRFQLGDKSRAKGGDVGGKYMERAFAKRMTTLLSRVQAAARNAL